MLTSATVTATYGAAQSEKEPPTKNPVRGGPQTGFLIWRSVNTPRNLGGSGSVLMKVYQGKSG